MFKLMLNRLFRREKNSWNESSEPIKLSVSLKENERLFRRIFEEDNTIVFRQIFIKGLDKRAILIYADGMVESRIINENLMKPLLNLKVNDTELHGDLVGYLMDRVITIDDVKEQKDVDQLVGAVLYGDTILIIDGLAKGIQVNTKGWKIRSIKEPPSERVVRGPREGFTESIIINTSLIKRKIKNTHLKFKFKELGTKTKTTVVLCYINGLANEKILVELEHRLNAVDLDSILETSYIEECIRDAPLSPFKTIGYTERPDVVASKLLEGRVAILVDGSPIVLTLPYIFMESFQSNEDYYASFIFSSINRMLRYFAFFLSTSTPAIYVALTTHHQEMIPTELLLSIASARQGVPFPTIVEALAMIVAFEILREAGIRLPEPVGPTVGIVGALIIGQAAVDARLVSAPIVIITALTGISGFLLYKMTGALVVVRIIFVLLASVIGMYGYIFGVIGLSIHLMAMRSFGIPYMLNIGAINRQDLKDTFIRAPWWYMYARPRLIGDKDPKRQGDAQRPKP